MIAQRRLGQRCHVRVVKSMLSNLCPVNAGKFAPKFLLLTSALCQSFTFDLVRLAADMPPKGTGKAAGPKRQATSSPRPLKAKALAKTDQPWKARGGALAARMQSQLRGPGPSAKGAGAPPPAGGPVKSEQRGVQVK